MDTKSNNEFNYASFGSRLLAYIIDGIILGIVIGIILVPIFIVLGLAGYAAGDSEAAAGGLGLIGTLLVIVVAVGLSWVYNAYAEASSWQGTLGKKIMGIKVVDKQGNKLTLSKSSIRFVIKTISASLISSLIFIVAAFTDNKQAIHDMVADTLVVKK